MKKWIAILLAMALILSLGACGTAAPQQTTAPETVPETTAPETTAAAGKAFTLTVTDEDGTETVFELVSDAENLGDALMAEGLVEGEMGDYGLYITSVNGIAADWETENAYWAFFIDGEYAQTGVDTTPIEEGARYSLVKTVSYTLMGEGTKTFYLTVQDVDGSVTRFQIGTDAATVGEALLALELIAGEESEYGLYITSVNGIAADWESEQAYWAFYIGGEYAMTGVDATEIAEGTEYALIKTVSAGE